MGLPKTETAFATNDIIKCFDKINENVGVNRAPVPIRHSGQAGDSGRNTFEKENLITWKIKRIKRASSGFSVRTRHSGRIGLGGRYNNCVNCHI